MNKEFNLIDTLKTEQELLVGKIANAREKGDTGTYKNLITALRDITKLIHEEDQIQVINRKINNYLYFEVNKDGIDVYYDRKIYRFVGSYDEIAERIYGICNSNKSVKVYGDSHGFGLGLADSLAKIGFKIEDTDLIICNFEKGKFLERKSRYDR